MYHPEWSLSQRKRDAIFKSFGAVQEAYPEAQLYCRVNSSVLVVEIRWRDLYYGRRWHLADLADSQYLPVYDDLNRMCREMWERLNAQD